MKESMVKYYSTQRPILPGGFPSKSEVVKIENFETKLFCEDIGRKAWGYIEYAAELTKEEAEAYELTRGGTKTFYCVTSYVYDSGKVRAAITDAIDAVCKPVNTEQNLDSRDIYKDWFDTKKDAEKFVEEVKTA